MKKSKLRFYIRIYRKVLVQDLKSKMSYRSDFIISLIGMLFTNISGFITFWILFQNFPSINGWGYYEMMFLYGFSLVSLTPVQCFFDNNWQLRMYVYSGDFIKYCFRPINLFFYYQSEIFDIKGYLDHSHHGSRTMPDGMSVTNETLIYECKISVINRERIIMLYYNRRDDGWTMTD